VTIGAGQSVSFTVTFTPSTPGSASGSLTFTSNASSSPTVQSLSGTGQPWVGLSWNASSGAVSYNIYRKLSTATSYTQIASGNTTASYTDNTVTAGDTYDYMVTAVNAEDQESGDSNMAQAVVPN
jgi:fibronectin type 3 domain-containing protein